MSAVRETKRLKPDVITMDIQMPLMDGLSALSEIMTDNPTPVVVLSAFTKENADVTVDCLEAGAVDFVAKPGGTISTNIDEVKGKLIKKIKLAAKANVKPISRKASRIPKLKKGIRHRERAKKVVVIAASTGGPAALAKIFPHFPLDMDAAVLIIQHMPRVFTTSLAVRLDASSALYVKEAEAGDKIANAAAYIAPGGVHMLVNSRKEIKLSDEPPVVGLRPCADYLLESVAKHYGENVIGVVLTGMGSDGAKGMATIRKHGGKVIAQDEDTSVVFGMPQVIIEQGNADKVLPISKIPKAIMEWI